MSVERIALTIQETAESLGISDKTVRQLIDSGQLRCIRAGTRVVIPVVAINEWVDTHLLGGQTSKGQTGKAPSIRMVKGG
jgi:excisionase family DNA binding protein